MLRFEIFCAALLLLVVALPAAGQERVAPDVVAPDAVTEPPVLSAQEKAFADAMSGAVLVGSFTADDAAGPPQPERYELGEVRKVGDGKWLLPTRIQYGKHDLTLPITLPIAWADDTAVIVVDKLGIPGLGVFSARVLMHDGRYAGYWEGAGHGGHLFGRIEPRQRASPTEPTAEGR